jgi:HAMP domain-containing protein
MSLRWKLILPLLCALGLAGVSIEAYWLPRSLERIERDHMLSMQRHLDTTAETLVPMVMGQQLDIINENLDALLAKNPDWLSIRLVDDRGRQLYPVWSAKPASQSVDHKDIRSLKAGLQSGSRTLATMEASVDLTSYLTEQRSEVINSGLAMMALLLLATVTLALLVEFVIHRPLRRLALAAAELAQGKYDTPLPTAGQDVLGELVRDFGAMRSTLGEQHAALKREIEEHRQAEAQLDIYRKHLEKQVESRTAELAAAKDAAEAANLAKSSFLANMSTRFARRLTPSSALPTCCAPMPPPRKSSDWVRSALPASICSRSSTTFWISPRSRPASCNLSTATFTSRRPSIMFTRYWPRPRASRGWRFALTRITCRSGCAATSCACARVCSTLPAMRSSSPSMVTLPSPPGYWKNRVTNCYSALKSATPALASPRKNSPRCFGPSSRPMSRPPVNMAAPGWGW